MGAGGAMPAGSSREKSMEERRSTVAVKSLRLVATPPANSPASRRGSRAKPAGFVQSAVPSSATAVAAPAIPADRGPTKGDWATAADDKERSARRRKALQRQTVICDSGPVINAKNLPFAQITDHQSQITSFL